MKRINNYLSVKFYQFNVPKKRIIHIKPVEKALRLIIYVHRKNLGEDLF